MKLLLDENLSRRAVPFLQTDFPGTSQVALEGLEQADDAAVWKYVKANGFVVVSKDSDFQEMSLLWGAPSKVVWLRSGNTSKAGVGVAHKSDHGPGSGSHAPAWELGRTLCVPSCWLRGGRSYDQGRRGYQRTHIEQGSYPARAERRGYQLRRAEMILMRVPAMAKDA